MTSTQATAQSQERNRRLLQYCTAGAGAAVLAGTVTTADASVVFINFNNQVFTDTSFDNGASTYFTSGTAGNFDFNGDGTVDFRLRQRASSRSSSGGLLNLAGFAAPTGGTINVVGTTNSGLAYPSRLAAGALIGNTATFDTLTNGATGYLASRSGFPASHWVSGSGSATGYLGVSFTANNQTYYGWIQLSVAGQDAATPYAITLSGIAYENTPGLAIRAGSLTSVPEPSSVALVALGGVGLAAYRRRRAAARKEAAVTESVAAQ